MDGLEKAFIWAGAQDFDHGMAVFKKLVDKLQSCHDEMRTKEYFASQLDKLPEPSWLEKRYIQGVFKFLPQLLLFGAKQFVQKAEDEIPPLPRGRPAPDAWVKAQIVAEIGKKEMVGCSHKQAKFRTARKFNMSLSTVQRIWDDRGNPGEVDFRSVLRYLSDDGELLAQLDVRAKSESLLL
jgi:ribosomal protein L28